MHTEIHGLSFLKTTKYFKTKMKKLLIKSCAFVAAVAAMALTACTNETQVVVSEEPTVTIELVGSVGTNSITARFVPSEGAADYCYALGSEQQRADFEAGDITGLMWAGGPNEVTFTWDALEVNTYYVVYAMAVDAAGTNGPVSARGVKTLNDDFLVTTYYLSDNSAAFTIECTDDYYTYRYALGTPEDRDAFINNETTLDIQSKSEVFNWTENYFGLDADTDYVFYCQATDRSERETQVFEIPVHTYAEGSDEIPNYTYEATGGDFFAQHYVVTPNALCQKLVIHQCEVDYNDDVLFLVNGYAGRLLEAFDAWSEGAGTSNSTCDTAEGGKTLNATLYNAGVVSSAYELGTPLEVYVTAYDAMFEPVHVKKFDNAVPSQVQADLPGATGMELVSDVNESQISVTINVTDTENICAYYYDFVDITDLGATVDDVDWDYVRTQFINGTSSTRAMWYVPALNPYNNVFTYTGNAEFVSGHQYVLAALPMNVNGPNDAGYGTDIIYSEVFTLP